jgi:hypothetical protein
LRRIAKTIAADNGAGMYGYIFTDDTVDVDLNTGMKNAVVADLVTLSPKTTPGKSFTLLPITNIITHINKCANKNIITHYRSGEAINLAAGYR